MRRRNKIRIALTAVPAGLAVLAGVGREALRTRSISIGVGMTVLWALLELFSLDLERFVGLRYLHRARRSGGARVLLVTGAALLAVGVATLIYAHGRQRIVETAAI